MKAQDHLCQTDMNTAQHLSFRRLNCLPTATFGGTLDPLLKVKNRLDSSVMRLTCKAGATGNAKRFELDQARL
jgi:hypothetical protein